MTTEERKELAQKPIIWRGDLSDDCTAEWAGLMLRAEWMDEDYWWWAVYDMLNNEITIEDSNDYNIRYIGGNAARLKAESVARKFIGVMRTCPTCNKKVSENEVYCSEKCHEKDKKTNTLFSKLIDFLTDW